MDHMRISDTEPSSVILSQTNYFKMLKRDTPKWQKQAEAKYFTQILKKSTLKPPTQVLS